MGRPVELSGGRVEGAPPSLEPSGDAERCVGRIVVGPSGDAARVGAGLATGARLRTTLAAGTSGTGAGAGSSFAVVTVATGGVTTSTLRADLVVVGRAASSGALEVLGALLGAGADLVTLAALAGSSGWTTRRNPSASARRRMRSACASSMDAEGLDAPIPNF